MVNNQFVRKRLCYVGAVTLFFGLFCKAPLLNLNVDEATAQIWLNNKKTIMENVASIIDGNLSTRGFAPARLTLNVFDFDHTLADNKTKVPVVNKAGQSRFVDSKCIPLTEGDKPDYSVFDIENNYKSEAIEPALRRLQTYTKISNNWNLILTARSGRRTFSMIQEYLWQRDAEPDAIVAANYPLFHQRLWERLNLPAGITKLPDGAKKPLVIAALIDIMAAKGSTIQTVRYFEDTDKYLGLAMAFLPNKFPQIRFEFYDYIRTQRADKSIYTEKFVAYGKAGKVFTPNNDEYKEPAAFDSGDCLAAR